MSLCEESIQGSLDPPKATDLASTLTEVLMACPSIELAANVEVDVELICDGALTMPATISDANPNNSSWVCSPMATYIDYAIVEAHRHLGRAAALPISIICKAMALLLRAVEFNRVVIVNNWMLSTNLYPALQTGQLQAIIEGIRQRLPKHAIWFRSLNYECNAEWLIEAKRSGFLLLPSRQVYLYRQLADPRTWSDNLRRDFRVLRQTRLHRISDQDIGAPHYARIVELYRMLYLDKYSSLNPAYTEKFLRLWHGMQLLELTAFCDEDGVIQAALGMFRNDRLLTAPIVGYNTLLPQSMGLYRLLMAQVFETAIESGLDVNLSAGAAHFKRLRGGRAAIEYSAVMVSHLPFATRSMVRILAALTTCIGLPMMRFFKL